jgi:4a-hydroxytetrahydrobiopterin dehydratase
LARAIHDALVEAGFTTFLPTSAHGDRPTQALEFAIDAIDIAAIRPFWKAVLGYVDKPGDDLAHGGLVDPAGQLPQVWFQQMDTPRTQRNRIHFDLAVAHDEAEARVAAGIAAGGTVVFDEYARSWWVLADAEGNEICVCTWLDRDERGW